ncbi:MAG TPA: cation-translocating P-type ATPase [Pseudoduganella sp.]
MAAPEIDGLTSAEAQARLVADGPNCLPVARGGLLALALRTMREPMFLLLLGAAILYLALGDWLEGAVLLGMVALNIGLTLYQEGRSERALEALRELSAPRALVLRDGQPRRVAGNEVVAGDVLLLTEGDRIAADAILLRGSGLRVDESLLTGEAWAVGKCVAVGALAPAAPGGEDTPYLWSGSLVVQGDGIARVTATGSRTALGKIGRSLEDVGVELSPLQRGITRMVRLMAIAAVAVSVLATVLYGLRGGEWMPAILAGIALTMALLPEEFAVIMTVFPAIGAWRMARAQVLTRRLAAIEALGSITVLCTDKTGTLTENRMHVEQLYADGEFLRLPAGPDGLPLAFSDLVRFSSLASKPHPSDPMEQALHSLAGLGRQDGPLREYPLSSALRAMSQVWDDGDAEFVTVAAKGAPEAIGALCQLGEAGMADLRSAADCMASQGLRVLGVARAVHAAASLPKEQQGFSYVFLGLLGLADPVRAEVPAAIDQCHAAGIRVIMITGDYPATAVNIAQRAGLPDSGLLNGDEIEQMTEAGLRERLAQAAVCARITPLQKLRIVEALKANGEIVAMTGDGVNDAPALKSAHVGIAMGQRGSDVAREAAALVLLDDNFASIVRGIRLGRRIFTNMRSAMSYVAAIHVPIAGIALLPAFLGWPVLLYPMHIAFLELIIDPTCSLAFENEASEAGAMERPPRPVDSPLLDRRTLAKALLQGVVGLAAVVLAYAWALAHLPEPAARAAGYAVLVLVNLSLVFSSMPQQRGLQARLAGSNQVPLIVAAVTGVMLLLALYLPVVMQIFQFSALPASGLLLVLACSAACYVVNIAAGRVIPRRPGPD